MSRLYFTSATGDAELMGAERAWLSHLATMHGGAAWDFDGTSVFDRCQEVVAMIPEVPDGLNGANYLHKYLREAEVAHERNLAGHRNWDHTATIRLLDSLRRRVATSQSDTEFVVGGHTLNAGCIILNTALAAGSDPIRVAAKLSGWTYTLIEGEDREWFADIIDEGLAGGMYRRDLKGRDMGWSAVAQWFRDGGDPVVSHHSTGDGFPERAVADWTPPPLPDGWVPSWADDAEGLAEWKSLDKRTKAEARESALRLQFYDLSDEEQWTLSLAGLRRDQWWCRLSPGTLRGVTFGPAVTVYDLLAPDRDARVQAALSLAQEQETASEPVAG